MSFKINRKNPNYLAKIIALPETRKHCNADKLLVVTIDAQNVITGLDAQMGALYIYFPLECAINKDYLSWSNSFSDPELNKDINKKGFFNSSGRVKAIRLRGERSEGYIIPANDIQNWLKSIGHKIDIDGTLVGTEFDSFENILICEKYVNKKAILGAQREENRNKKKVKRESKLVENQFRLHEDTEQLKRNIHKLELDDLISIGYKMHGTSVVIGKVLCKKPLRIYEKVLKKLGINIVDTHYDLVYSSRSVIKNAYADKKHNSFYQSDIWGTMAEKYKNCLKDGITLYGEIVGQLPTGAWIQKKYDYGCNDKNAALYIYRITYTSLSGDVFEFTTPQVQRYCQKFGLNMVPIFYYGMVKDFLITNSKYLDVNDWRNTFINLLMEEYTEKDCYMCKSRVPCEGAVIIKESDFYEAYKLKSFAFLEGESKELDSGEVNIEDNQEILDTNV